MGFKKKRKNTLGEEHCKNKGRGESRAAASEMVCQVGDSPCPKGEGWEIGFEGLGRVH